MSIVLRAACESDLTELASMNKQLIDDEGSSNPMTLSELEDRMKAWFLSNWNIDLLCIDSEIVGYALYQFRENQYFKDKQEVYLRQYYIKPDFRMQGYGRKGIETLKNTRFHKVSTIVVDVLVNNYRGICFWQKVGFIPYQTTMKFSK